MRLDQWLWAVRIYKTRAVSAEQIRAAHVRVNEEVKKPAYTVRAGDVIKAKCGRLEKTVRVLGAPVSRVGAKCVVQYLEDLTAPEVYAALNDPAALSWVDRLPGAGRPTKRDRRELDSAWGAFMDSGSDDSRQSAPHETDDEPVEDDDLSPPTGPLRGNRSAADMDAEDAD